MAFSDFLNRKYDVEEQNAASQRQLAQAQAGLYGAQAGVLPGEAAARNYATRQQGDYYGAQSNLTGVQAQLAPLEFGSADRLRQAQGADMFANARLTNTNANLAPFSTFESLDASQRSLDSTARAAPAQFGAYGFRTGTDMVPGKGDGTVDTTPAMLAPGEAVLNKGAAEHLGRDTIDLLNAIGARKMGLNIDPRAAQDVSSPTMAKAQDNPKVNQQTGGTPGYAMGGNIPGPQQVNPPAKKGQQPDLLPANRAILDQMQTPQWVPGVMGAPHWQPAQPPFHSYVPQMPAPMYGPPMQPQNNQDSWVHSLTGIPVPPRDDNSFGNFLMRLPGSWGDSRLPGYAGGTSQVPGTTNEDYRRTDRAFSNPSEPNRNDYDSLMRSSVAHLNRVSSVLDAVESGAKVPGYAKGTSKVPGKGKASAKGSPKGGAPGLTPQVMSALMKMGGGGGMPSPNGAQPMPMQMPMTAPMQ